MAQRVKAPGIFGTYSHVNQADLLSALSVPRDQHPFETRSSRSTQYHEDRDPRNNVHTRMGTNAEVDHLLMTGNGKQVVGANKQPVIADLWTGTVVVAPTIGVSFPRGDIHDGQSFRRTAPGWRWMVTASSIPKIALGRDGVGVVIDAVPVDYDEKRKLVVVSAAATSDTVHVLHGFIQSKMGYGVVHEATRIPVEIGESKVEDADMRMLLRPALTFVRPVSRTILGAPARSTVNLTVSLNSSQSCLEIDMERLRRLDVEITGLKVR